jgi:hypothetical protein
MHVFINPYISNLPDRAAVTTLHAQACVHPIGKPDKQKGAAMMVMQICVGGAWAQLECRPKGMELLS